MRGSRRSEVGSEGSRSLVSSIACGSEQQSRFRTIATTLTCITSLVFLLLFFSSSCPPSSPSSSSATSSPSPSSSFPFSLSNNQLTSSDESLTGTHKDSDKTDNHPSGKILWGVKDPDLLGPFRSPITVDKQWLARLREYARFHERALRNPLNPGLQWLVFQTQEMSGLANRLPGIITGLNIAMATNRVFLVNWVKPYPSLPELFSPDPHILLDCSSAVTFASSSLETEEARFLRSVCSTERLSGHFTLNIMTSLVVAQSWLSMIEEVPVVKYWTKHYDLPLMELNPTSEAVLRATFPTGPGRIAQVCDRLFRPTGMVQALVDDFLQPAIQKRSWWQGWRRKEGEEGEERRRKYMIGIHVRTRHSAPGTGATTIEHYLRTAETIAITNSWPPNETAIVLASDDLSLIPAAKAYLASTPYLLIYNNNGRLGATTETEQSRSGASGLQALAEMISLAYCQALVATESSTFSFMAATLGNVVPIVAYAHPHGPHYGWIAEPCVWTPMNFIDKIKDFRSRARLMLYAQCTWGESSPYSDVLWTEWPKAHPLPLPNPAEVTPFRGNFLLPHLVPSPSILPTIVKRRRKRSLSVP